MGNTGVLFACLFLIYSFSVNSLTSFKVHIVLSTCNKDRENRDKAGDKDQTRKDNAV